MIADMDTSTYQGMTHHKVLVRHFTPLVLGGEAAEAAKCRICLLTQKWYRDYSQLYDYVHMCLSLALVYSTSLILHGAQGK